MITPLCALALISFQTNLKPLPEERDLLGVEQVALEYARVEVPGAGNIGWTKTTVQRGNVDGATHYLVHQTAEILNFETLGLVTMESRGLYNGDLQLVHELRLAQPLGEESTPLELEWTDDGFHWREGRKKWSEASPEIRPTVKSDVALFARGLDLKTPFVAHVFDEKTKKFETRTLGPGKEIKVDDEERMEFKAEGLQPISHRLTPEGVYMDSTIGELQIVALDAAEDTEGALRMLVADNEAFAATLGKALPGQWVEKKGSLSHPTLGISLKLPKGWKRAPKSEVDGVVLRAYSPDDNAYLNITISVLGTGYDLDGWKDGLIEYYAETAEGGKVSSKKKKLAKQEAMQFEFVASGKSSFSTLAYALKHNGIGFAMVSGTWTEAPKKLKREVEGIFKTVKF
ncbi:MAG: hypothetical protein AAGG01_00285 [Planctomycetota bacterium]